MTASKIEPHDHSPGIIGMYGGGAFFSIYQGRVERHVSYQSAHAYLLRVKGQHEDGESQGHSTQCVCV